MTSRETTASSQVRGSLGKISVDIALCLVRGSVCVHYRCWARLLVDRGAAVEPCHQVAVGGAGGGKFVVAVLEVLASVEELLFEVGNTLTESADFVGSRDAGVVEDLFAEDFGQPLAELGVLVAQSFVVCAQVGEVGQQRAVAGAGAGRVKFGFGGQGEDLRAQVVVAIQKRAVDAGRAGDRGDGDLVAGGAESVEGIEDFATSAIAVVAPRGEQRARGLCCHGWLSRFGSSAGELVVGRPRCTVWRVRRTMWRLPRSVAGRCRRARR